MSQFIIVEFWRVLKPSGSLYLFCGSKLAAEIEVLMKSRFNVLNHIVWAKPSGVWKRAHKPALRSFFPATERIIFAEHYGAEGFAKGANGYATKCSQLKREVFKPLIDYFKNAREALNISAKEINQATNSQMCSHWFSSSQWKLPTQVQYEQLQTLFNTKGGELLKAHDDLVIDRLTLQKKYEVLKLEYADLRQQYEDLRRPFSVTSEVPYTDVWTYPPVAYYPGKHPCEKPADLLDHVILTSSQEGQVVLDAFMGSGSTGKECIKLNRQFIGIEMEAPTFNKTLIDLDK
ncbi:DNA-methyltransferase [Psychromonas sp. Urea-02u-13]|uniref:DNA-methyltransferase n=1 Tax=Psychromonas sp. Urea-02u-13 TaxID=2058326 RepID=UPI000C34CC1C|nr:site-specific DNA-methyltransferase [Psychromonas sp. Urea-02u-13]PKG37316.1 site-specific DNA-methyltransferase [Psychromonas sp. Urea-02u-13]